ncbi:MAG: NAD(P)/FAD-dependent oxidoreductase [Gammaproteobacteria bacterium]|nr:NAD(P)/FAD-dependent oxidoreductase [Gammaproteobacteria bacterium]
MSEVVGAPAGRSNAEMGQRGVTRAREAYDAVVVGAGHNALVTAATLAREGWKVLVLERRGIVGGAAATDELFPGCRVNVAAQDAGLFQREIVSELGLDARELEWVHPPAAATSLTGGGEALTLWRDPGRTRDEIARHSPADAQRFPEWADYLRSMARVLRIALEHPPPILHGASARERLRMLRPLLRAGRLGKRTVVELLRALPLSARDLLDDWFVSDALKGMLATSALPGGRQGPSAMGGAFRMFYHAAGSEACGFRSTVFVKGGIGVLSEALADAARMHGAEVRTGADVETILVEDGVATGVLLAGGEEVYAGCVVSGVDPRRTFFELVGAPRLGPEFNRKVANIQLHGTTAALHLLLDGLPPLPDAADRLSGRTLVAPDLEYLERAGDDAKYGRCSSRPHLDLVVPTLHNPALAPAGRHLASVQIRYAPYRLRSGSWEDGATRDALLAGALGVLDEFLPGLRERIVDHRLLTPLDLETELGLTGGDEYHGQMGLDQLLFMRPVPGWGRYRTPVERLFLCGSGTHPGGGVTGGPGRLATREILRDGRRGAPLGGRDQP